MGSRQEINLCLAGEAGQGLQTMGRLLGETLARSGYSLLVTQTYHSRIRGGHNTYAIRCGTARPQAPCRRLDLLVALNEESVELHQDELTEGGLLVVDRQAKSGGELKRRLTIPFEELAHPRMKNTVALGVCAALLGLDPRQAIELVNKRFANKKATLLAENQQALEQGYQWTVTNRPPDFAPLGAVEPRPGRLLLSGNDAIALGALAAGLKFCSFYPMSPATSIIMAIIAQADRLGVICEQAEDEIAAVNMAIGASFAGAPSLVATSGGGLALMSEGVSLAAITETPLLLIVGQRPGPATGLPTRTEQGDLELVLHAGHGEFPRAVLAPTTVEECFALTQQGLHLAEKSQGPVFLLTDQYFADSLLDIDRHALPAPHPVGAGTRAAGEGHGYQRYRLTGNGLSPRRLPGVGQELVAADSHEHDEAGHTTENLAIRVKMVEKRLLKMKILERETIAPTYDGDQQAELLFLCWGSSRGPVLEAADILRQQGRTTAVLAFSQVWPLLAAQFLELLLEAEQVVAVEGNATAQFSRLISRETGFFPDHFIGRYDGLAFDAAYILERLPLEPEGDHHDHR